MVGSGGKAGKLAPPRPDNISGIASAQSQNQTFTEKIAYGDLGAGFGQRTGRSIIPHFRGVVNRQNKQNFLAIFVQIAQ